MFSQKFYIILLSFIFQNLLSSCAGKKFSYKNYKAYEIGPIINEEQIQNLESLENEDRFILFLDSHFIANKTNNNVIVAPQKENYFKNILITNNIPFQLRDKNIQETLDYEEKIFQRSDSQTKIYDWTTYHTLDETYSWLKNLSEIYPKHIKLLTAGSTYEGRKILGVKLSYKNDNKGIFIEGGMHAREWISPATTTYILNELLHSDDSQIRYIAENFDWYIFPHTNPDGYVYTHTRDRLWRKTRSNISGNNRCIGVDPNRNFDNHWNEQGTSSNPCSDAYAGSGPFSEIETKTFSKFISSLRGKLNLYLSFHSYSQLLLFPYGYTSKRAPNHSDLQKIGNIAASALSKRYGTEYKVGNVYDTIYPASGSSIEWAYDVENIKLSYCYELRPKSSSLFGGWGGFILPPDQIIPTGKEIMDSLIALLAESKKLNYFGNKPN